MSSERSTVYFDTGDFRLARWGDSFRYRAGEGWTVKLSGDDYGALLVRDEVVFEGSPTTPPRGAVDLVPGYLRRAELGPKVRLRTVCRGVLLNDVQGRLIVDVDDDRVSVLDGQRVVTGFREREVETTGDTPSGLLTRCSYACAPPAQCVGLWPVVGLRRRGGAIGIRTGRYLWRLETKERAVTDKRQKRAAEFIEPFRVRQGSKVALGKDFDPAFKAEVKKKKEGVALLKEGVRLLSDYQARLAAQDTWGVLVVLQAMDTAGKDGTIRHVMSGVNPQGVAVHSFKVPSADELDHDFLWRYAQRLPARGEIGIFNRSHYEEVLVVRVHPENLDRQKLPKAAKTGDVWKRRYREINDWERYLTDNGFRIVKLFLNVSKEEQRARLLRRIDLPDHNWKFSPADVAERERWDDYQRAFSEVLSHTSTEWAPWYVIPADRKWFGRIGAAAVLVHTLMEIDPRYPPVSKRQRQALLEVKETLEAQVPKHAAPDPFEQQEGR